MTDEKKWELIRAINEACKTPEDKGRFMASLLENNYNAFNTKEMTKAMCEQLTTTTHRTIQQSIMNGAIQYLKAMSEVQYTDPRNEMAVKAATIAYNTLYESGLDLLPMI